jgi:FAD:protein FMN transferase
MHRRDLLGFAVRQRRPAAGHWIRIHRTAMACRFEIMLSGEEACHVQAAREALGEANRLEATLTVYRDTSDLMRLNRHAADAAVSIDQELFHLLSRCRALHTHTGGAFDITTTPLSRCWGFYYRQGRLPSLEAIREARDAVGMPEVELDSSARTVRFRRPGIELNLGSIGKGYAVQRIGAALRGQGVRHALVTAGSSSVLALGGRGRGWCIDLHSRQVAGGRLARLHLRNGALGTSGAGEQFVEIDGARYGHVIDPRTGWPASGVLSATVVTADAASADALATAFLVGGLDLAARYCNTHPGTLALVTPDDGSGRPRILGGYDGVGLEDA